MSIQYVDVHSHIPFSDFDATRTEVLARMAAERVATIAVGVDAASSSAAVAFAEEHEGVFATIGLHPNAVREESFDWAVSSKLAAHRKVVAVGECGLDYFRSPDAAATQKEQFLIQQDFALAHGLPLMIHCRTTKKSDDAYEDLLKMLDPRARGNIHFFTGSLRVAEQFWARGFSTSFTGVITFTHDYDEVVRAAPLDMILTETDAPYAAPTPHRGTNSEPSHVPLIVRRIAELKGLSEQEVAAATVKTAGRIFPRTGLC